MTEATVNVRSNYNASYLSSEHYANEVGLTVLAKREVVVT